MTPKNPVFTAGLRWRKGRRIPVAELAGDCAQARRRDPAQVEYYRSGHEVVIRIGMESPANEDPYVHSLVVNVRLMGVDALQAMVPIDGINLVSGNWYVVNGTQVARARETG